MFDYPIQKAKKCKKTLECVFSSGLCYTYAIGMMKSYTTYHIGERYSTYLRKHFWKKYIAWMQKSNSYDFPAYGAYIVREEE